jgi:hypothetical protein
MTYWLRPISNHSGHLNYIHMNNQFYVPAAFPTGGSQSVSNVWKSGHLVSAGNRTPVVQTERTILRVRALKKNRKETRRKKGRR